MRRATLIAALALVVTSRAEAQKTLDFFDIPHDFHATEINEWEIPDGYGGLHWISGGAFDERYSAPDWGTFSLVGNAVASAAGFHRSTPFRFYGLYVGNDARYFDDTLEPPPGWPFMTATVGAYLRGRLVRTITIAEPSTWSASECATDPAFMDFGGVWVDSVVTAQTSAFSAVTLDTTPEPMSMALLATGLLGLGVVGWRKRRQGVV